MLVSLLVIGVVALVVWSITLMTGFGLGTLLLPVVHAANNFFKLALLRSSIDRLVLVRFGRDRVVHTLTGVLSFVVAMGLGSV